MMEEMGALRLIVSMRALALHVVAMPNGGERLVCFVDNFGSPPTFAGDP